MFPYIVADVGGTNARFALVTEKKGDQFTIENIQILKGADFNSFQEAFSHYYTNLSGMNIRAACIAIAAPMSDDVIKMTNLPWSFSQSAMCKEFDLKAFKAINDYTALAVATSRLPVEGLANVVEGKRDLCANKAILGPGTGLGVAGLAYIDDEQWLPISSEGGHVNIPPVNALECEIIKAALPEHSYVSAETFLSGQGLVNLYKALALVEDFSAGVLMPYEITDRAITMKDPNCVKTLDLFCGFLGSVSANLALTYGAHGGVYITGGIVPRFVDYLRQSPFYERFKQKGVMSPYMSDIPVDVVTFEQPAFLGAAAWLYQFMKNKGL